MNMYKIYERQTESLLRKVQKIDDAPEWLLEFARELIERAKFYRVEADSESAKLDGVRSNLFKKALDTVVVALEVLEAFMRFRNSASLKAE